MNPQQLDFMLHYAHNHFKLDLGGVHGFGHWMNVFDRGLTLAEVTGANKKVVELFAMLHDYKREDDGPDEEHGKRAADSLLGLQLSGMLELEPQEFSDLHRAILLHSEGRTDGNITVQTCWDADRLDLWRVGVMPSERYLCTDAAKAMLKTMDFK